MYSQPTEQGTEAVSSLLAYLRRDILFYGIEITLIAALIVWSGWNALLSGGLCVLLSLCEVSTIVGIVNRLSVLIESSNGASNVKTVKAMEKYLIKIDSTPKAFSVSHVASFISIAFAVCRITRGESGQTAFWDYFCGGVSIAFSLCLLAHSTTSAIYEQRVQNWMEIVVEKTSVRKNSRLSQN